MNTWQKLKWPLVALALVLLFNLLAPAGMLEAIWKGEFSSATELIKDNSFFQLKFQNGRVFGSLVDILHRAAPVMLIALGMTLVIATGGVDLSVGSVMAIAGAIAALFLNRNFPPAAVIAIALGAAAFFGVWNGVLVGFFKVTPIVATLILMVSGRGIAQLLTDGQIITFSNASFEYIGRGAFLGLPFTITLVLLSFLVLTLFTRRTAAGLFIESTGDNEKASSYAGVNTRFVKTLVYAICAMLAGLAGLIVTTDIKAADANNAGQWIELDAILAVVIGGTALTGGRFFFAGSLIGAILIQALTTTILTRGVPVQWTLVVKALVILGVCLLQSEKFRSFIVPRSKRIAV